MAGLCEGGNVPPGFLKASLFINDGGCSKNYIDKEEIEWNEDCDNNVDGGNGGVHDFLRFAGKIASICYITKDAVPELINGRETSKTRSLVIGQDSGHGVAFVTSRRPGRNPENGIIFEQHQGSPYYLLSDEESQLIKYKTLIQYLSTDFTGRFGELATMDKELRLFCNPFGFQQIEAPENLEVELKICRTARRSDLRMPNFGKIKYTKDQLMSAVAAVRDGERIKTSAKKFGVPRSTLQRYIKGQNKSTFGPKSVLSGDEEEENKPEEITVDSMKVVTDKERDQPEDNGEIIERQLSSQSQVDAVEIASNEHFQTEEVGANMGIQEDNLLKTPEKNLSNEEKKTLRRSEVRTLEDCLIWPETRKRKNIRKTERMPYVLTSKKWRALFRNKEEKKAEEERKKEERKRKREMNNGGKIAKRKRSVESTKHVKHGRKIMARSKSGVKMPPIDPDALKKAVEAFIAPPGNKISMREACSGL
ncbi:hypothetical protein ANN_17085 [Periplaneta americana]|uniref:HTH psq-type domain-containing protein n=1 Tax=Periplaneta americana TaxID=6978 RepID=A0ABQ8SSQ9_PERAM|nr:hypothetical protein ANN_17085 [Periplaneta americana]